MMLRKLSFVVLSLLLVVFVSMPLVCAVQWDIFDGDKMFYVFGDNSSAIPIIEFCNENFSTYLYSNGTGLYYRQGGVLFNLTNGSASGGGGDGCYWINDSGSLVFNGGPSVNLVRDEDVFLYMNSSTGASIIRLNSLERPSYRYTAIDFNVSNSIGYFDSDVDSSDRFFISAFDDFGVDIYPDSIRTLLKSGDGTNSFRFNDTGFEFPYKANNWASGTELHVLDIRYTDGKIAVFGDYRDTNQIIVKSNSSDDVILYGVDAEVGVPSFILSSSIDKQSSFLQNVYIDGKLTVVGGVDPPYVSFSGETFDSIRKLSVDVKGDQLVMQFWSVEFHRMMVYEIESDSFYDLFGVCYS